MGSCRTVGVYAEEQATVLEQRQVKAQKEHKCMECGRVIKKGEKYERQVTEYYRDFTYHKTCLDCLSLRDVFFKDYYMGRILEDLKEHIWECRGEVAEKQLGELTPRAREMVCGWIEEVGGDEA